MESRHVETLKDFAYEQSELGAPPVNRRVLLALEAFGRERLSTSFFMRDFLYSEISAVHGIPNVPSDPELAVEAGRGLCTQLLEPLHRIFGQVVVRSAFRSRAVNAYGNEHNFSCATNESNRGRHIWDWRDGDDLVGATACIVIPWFNRHRALQGDPGLAPARLVHSRPPAVLGNGLLREKRRL